MFRALYFHISTPLPAADNVSPFSSPNTSLSLLSLSFLSSSPLPLSPPSGAETVRAPEAVSRCGTILPSVEEMSAVGGRPASASASASGCLGGRGISERGGGGEEEERMRAEEEEGWRAEEEGMRAVDVSGSTPASPSATCSIALISLHASPSASPPINRLPSPSTLHPPLFALSRIILLLTSPSILLASAFFSASNAHPNFSSRLRLFSSSRMCTKEALSSDVKLRWNASRERSSRTGGSRRCLLGGWGWSGWSEE